MAPCAAQNHLTSGADITAQWSAEASGYPFDTPKWKTCACVPRAR